MTNTTKPEIKGAPMNVYCCGGAGVNIGFMLQQASFLGLPGYADMRIIFVDTGVSNMRGRTPDPRDTYIIDGRDGSGGLRIENSKSIAMSIDSLLLQHPPARYNVVISSVSGGSGSVIAPNLIDKMLADDALVVGVVIGDTTTGIYAKNTVKTIQSFSGVVSKYPMKTLPLTVVLNHRSRTRQSVDNAVCQHVSYYAALFSESLMALDFSDVYNWVHQERVTGISAPLTMVSANYSDASGGMVEDPATSPVDFETVATMLSLMLNEGELPLVSEEYPLPYATAGTALEDYSELYMPGNLNLLTHTNVGDFFEQINGQHINAQRFIKARKIAQPVPVSDTADANGVSY